MPLTLLLLTVAAGCSEKSARDLGFGVSFACEADREASDQLELRVLPGGCSGEQEPIYTAQLLRGGAPAPEARNLKPGMYGVWAEARSSEDGEPNARGCRETMLPAQEPFDVLLDSLTGACDGMDADLEDAGQSDGSGPEEDGGGDPDASGDGSQDEAGGGDDASLPDAAPIPCTADCNDDNPCTEDSCDESVGNCVNAPVSMDGVECDGVACTQGDRCVEGNCFGGDPNNALCNDDGNPCTVESCNPSSGGCVRNNAPESTNCDAVGDGISCTGAHRCRSGVCRGTSDTCTPPAVCSVLDNQCKANQCTTATAAVNCNDGDPCTNDICNAGVCGHTPNTGASCNDQKDCTSPDVCSAGVCAGTSTCGTGATCGGSACTCTDANQTLCGNNCVTLSSNASHCGACNRACPSGYSCQNGACKPGNATGCTAHRSGSHDYLFCSGPLGWTAARAKCAEWRMALVAVDNSAENNFLRTRLASPTSWTGANDRGSNGSNCTLSSEEGRWYWSATTFPNNTPSYNDNGVAFCSFANNNANSCTVASGRYQNWASGEPNNSGCGCSVIIICGDVTEGQDCGVIRTDGTWDDDSCSKSYGFVCETP